MRNNLLLGQRIRNSFNPSYNTVMNAYEDQMLAEQVAGEPNVLDELGNRYDPQLSGEDIKKALSEVEQNSTPNTDYACRMDPEFQRQQIDRYYAEVLGTGRFYSNVDEKITKIDKTRIENASKVISVAKTIYETDAKIEAIEVLEKAGKLHEDKMIQIGKAKDLEEALEVFSTPKGKTYNVLKNTKVSPAYRILNRSGKVLSAASVSAETYNTYLSNAKYGKNIQWRETISTAAGSSADVVAGGMVSHTVALGFASVGIAFLPGVGTAIGYGIGSIAGAALYESTGTSDFVKNHATNLSRNAWDYSHNNLNWR